LRHEAWRNAEHGQKNPGRLAAGGQTHDRHGSQSLTGNVPLQESLHLVAKIDRGRRIGKSRMNTQGRAGSVDLVAELPCLQSVSQGRKLGNDAFE
jgi:hypothetical protein